MRFQIRKIVVHPMRSVLRLRISWNSSIGWLQVILHLVTENREQQFRIFPVSFFGLVFAQRILLPGWFLSSPIPRLLFRTEKKTGQQPRQIKNSGWIGKRNILLSGTELGGSNLKNTLYITSWWLSLSSAGCAYMRRASKSAVTGAPRLLGKLFGGNTVNRHQL